jgi:hypothetical protein
MDQSPEDLEVPTRAAIFPRRGAEVPDDLALSLPQHPDEHRPERPVLLAVDQQLGEGAALRVAPELSDPVGSLEVGEHQDVKELGAGSGPRASIRSRRTRSTCSRFTDGTPAAGYV